MDNSLLVSFRPYRPREDRDSVENFITEGFAWRLRNAGGISKAVSARLQRAMREGKGFALPRHSNEIEWSTQVRRYGSDKEWRVSAQASHRGGLCGRPIYRANGGYRPKAAIPAKVASIFIG